MRVENSLLGHEGAKLTCPNCGMEHEVECGEALDLSTNEKTEIVMLVPVEKGQNQTEYRASEN